jgi:hypothetical protein
LQPAIDVLPRDGGNLQLRTGQHVTRLRELDQGNPRLLGSELLESVVCYGNKRLYEHMIARGWASTNPYADFDEWAIVPQCPEAAANQNREQEVEFDLTMNV